MFKKWFKKKEKKIENLFYGTEAQDAIEESSKRKNLHHMHEMISRKEKYE